jgi:glucoamylase
MTSGDPPGLASWIALQAQRSAAAMQRAISATHLMRRREAFGQIVAPAKGSVLASPEIADWNPEPDYFFHWLRDSAIVMRCVADLMADAAAGDEHARWQRHFEDFVRFSLALGEPSSVTVAGTRREFRKFLRPESQIRALTGDALLGEPRFNADGSVDVFRWSRPQYDGPALRALAVLRYLAAGGPQTDELVRLLRADLDFTLRHAGNRCVGPWEEAEGKHYYVALVQLGALVYGRAFAQNAAAWDQAERGLRTALDRHWSQRHGLYRASRAVPIDASVLLAVLDAGLPEGPHSAADPRVHATQRTIEDLFAREFPINRGRTAPALGRYPGDSYFGGGAWYPTTLAAASLHYRIGRVDRGDAVMATVRDLTPADGALSEQVDRATGEQTSARHLTWSYAAFVGAARLRARASGSLSSIRSSMTARG